jgi:hypothetical protein
MKRYRYPSIDIGIVPMMFSHQTAKDQEMGMVCKA